MTNTKEKLGLNTTDYDLLTSTIMWENGNVKVCLKGKIDSGKFKGLKSENCS